MNSFVRDTAIASAIALLTVGSADLAGAQNKKWSQEGCGSPQECAGRMQRSGDEERRDHREKAEQSGDREEFSGEQFKRKRRNVAKDGNDDWQPGEDFAKRRKSMQSKSDWNYDSRKHKRRRNRDDRFRFEFGGFWYPEPYWGYGYSMHYGISCRDGREILIDRGFRRVSVIECRGGTFTYLGRRHGDTYRVLVSSRTGRIVSVRPA